MPDAPTAYRPCVGILLFDAGGRVFSGRRRLDATSEAVAGAPALWQFPQGGIDQGETPRAAALRELEEETGIVKARLLYELPGWLAYDLPDELVGVALKGRYRGQKQKWFLMRFTGDDTDIRLDAHQTPEFDAWDWQPIEECVARVVAFKRPIYAQLAALLGDFDAGRVP